MIKGNGQIINKIKLVSKKVENAWNFDEEDNRGAFKVKNRRKAEMKKAGQSKF